METFVSSASLTVGNRVDPAIRSPSRPSPFPSPLLPRTSTTNLQQPILHPVLQRRSTPFQLQGTNGLHRNQRRLTQPINFSSENNFTHYSDKNSEESENLSTDKTGRLPIPPPRGPRYKVGLSRNVSQNGLRSPKLMAKTTRNGSDAKLAASFYSDVMNNRNGLPVGGLRVESSPPVVNKPRAKFPENFPIPGQKCSMNSGQKLGVVHGNSSKNSEFTGKKSKFYIDISPVGSPLRQRKPDNITRVKIQPSGPVIHPAGMLQHQHAMMPQSQSRPSFDEIVDEIFKTIGTDDHENVVMARYGQQEEYPKCCWRCGDSDDGRAGRIRAHSTDACPFNVPDGLMMGGRGKMTNGYNKDCRVSEYLNDNVNISQNAISAYAYNRPPLGKDKPSPLIHRSKSDVSRQKHRINPHRTTAATNLHLRGIDNSGFRGDRSGEWPKDDYFDDLSANTNIMQRMRKSLGNLRTGVLSKLNKQPQYTRKSSCPCDLDDEEPIEANMIMSSSRFYAGLPQQDNHNVVEKKKKPTSADSGIVDMGHEGDEISSSSRHARPTSTEYSSAASGCGSPMRRSRSCNPPGRLVSFAAQVDDKSSDLDRSVSARSSRTSELSNNSSSGFGNGNTAQATETTTNPLYIESLWSQVKYEVDCEQPVTDCSVEAMRANIVKEIVKNERDFVRNLKDVIEGYLYKCRQRPDMFSKGRIECIFGNVEHLYEFQCEFLADLESSIINNNIHLSEIGHCFLLHQRGFSDLYSDYCNNHTQSAAELQQLKQIKQYAHFFEACRMLQDMMEISLDGFLLQPVQKICKYPLQLNELLKYTPDDHPDCQSVKLALAAMKSVTGMINERKRRLECLEKIALWQETIDLWDGEDLVERSSQLVHYGDLNKLSSKNSWTHEYAFFLFDHQLIYCRRDMLKRTLFTYKGRFDMDQVEIVDLEQNDAGIKYGWVVVCPDKDQSTILLAKSLAEKQKWMDAFQDERLRVHSDAENGFAIAPKDRLAAIQTAKLITAGKEKRSKTKDALKDLTDHTQLVQSMRSKSLSMTLPVRIRVGRTDKRVSAAKLPFNNNAKDLSSNNHRKS